MAAGDLLSRLHRALVPRRAILLTATALLIGFSFAQVGTLSLEQDIGVMLPDGGGRLADHLWLQGIDQARRVAIDLARDPSVTDREFLAAAARVQGALAPPLFSGILSLPGNEGAQGAEVWLAGATPNLFTEEARLRAAALSEPGRIASRLEEVRRLMAGPEAWVLEASLRRDPLGLAAVAAEGLRRATVAPDAAILGGRIATPDGTHLLIVADTPVPVTDFAGASRIDAVVSAALAGLPAGVRGSWISGHRYTLANASAIRRDLAVVLSVSAIAVLLIYVVMLRSRYAIAVFLVPVSVVALAGAGVSLVYPAVFAVTIGFGGVLLGMADEYAMHVYFHLRRGGAPPDAIVGGIARPVLVGGGVTAAAFGVMLLSSLPGQRQLAVFCLLGIAASLLISLVVLPHLIPPGPPQAGDGSRGAPPRRPPRWIAVPWSLVLLLCAALSSGLTFDGRLSSMGLVPDELRRAEASFRETWGGIRDRAVVYVEGATPGEALDANDALHERLGRSGASADVVSLATVLPGPAAQTANRGRWRSFWSEGEGRAIAGRLQEEASRIGFSEAAFAPFRDSLAAETPAMTMEDLSSAGLAPLVSGMIVTEAGRVRVLTFVPDTQEVAAAVGEEAGGPRLVSLSRFGAAVGDAIAREFLFYLAAASGVILLLTFLMFRRVGSVLLACVPVATGLLFMFGVMGAAGIPFNLFNIVATVLIIGLCIDYGIFMVHHLQGEGAQAADRSVLVSGLTTVAGLGSLVLARHPALHSIGLTVVLGFAAAIPAALLVVPALARRRPESR